MKDFKKFVCQLMPITLPNFFIRPSAYSDFPRQPKVVGQKNGRSLHALDKTKWKNKSLTATLLRFFLVLFYLQVQLLFLLASDKTIKVDSLCRYFSKWNICYIHVRKEPSQLTFWAEQWHKLRIYGRLNHHCPKFCFIEGEWIFLIDFLSFLKDDRGEKE